VCGLSEVVARHIQRRFELQYRTLNSDHCLDSNLVAAFQVHPNTDSDIPSRIYFNLKHPQSHQPPPDTYKCKDPELSDPKPDAFQQVPRHRLEVLLLQPIRDLLQGKDIDLADLVDKRGAVPDPVTEVEDDEDGQGDVGGEEVGGGEIAGEEDLEAVGEGQDDEEDEGEVGHVGLEDGFVGPLLEHGMVGQGFAETLRVGCQDGQHVSRGWVNKNSQGRSS